MADLREALLRAILAQTNAGRGLVLVLAGHPWQCCPGARAKGPGGCTCWIPIYDREQASPTPETVSALALGHLDPSVRDGMCGDCAYRPGSPERTGDDGMDLDADKLEELAATGRRFFCHDGMRAPKAWLHPKAGTIPAAGAGDYQPLIIDCVPYRADGQPALVCAGWAARGRALAAPGRTSRQPQPGGADDCENCGLPDNYQGQGDGIGSCDCPRCGCCRAGPLQCECARDVEDPEERDELGDDYLCNDTACPAGIARRAEVDR